MILEGLHAQQRILLKENDMINVPVGLNSKILSGKLLMSVSEKSLMMKKMLMNAEAATTNVLLYFQDYPTTNQQDSLRNLGIQCYWETWTPALDHHPNGFVVATLPVSRFIDALSLGFLTKMGTAEASRSPKNNEAARSIGTDSLWSNGWTGTGIKVGILDSGLDTDPPNSDLPDAIQVRDYSRFPNVVGTTVLNHVTGHGTHVTGTVLGRGTLSSLNTGNGGGSFKGMAPNAGLVFLKIGNDSTAESSTAADIAAMHAAVDTFHVNVLSMSYGGWDVFHDGSDPEDQVVDWVYSKGVPFFLSAGNDGASNRHYSGTVAAFDTTGFIEVNVFGAATNSTKLAFNLVWESPIGGAVTSLDLRYYNSSQNVLAVTPLPKTTSARGTNSQYSHYDIFLPSGNGIYFLKVVNHSPTSLTYHIYEDWEDRKVQFATGDPSYTIGQPASADHAIAVGAYFSRKFWSAYDGNSYHFNSSNNVDLGDIAPFSSRGPRVDGLTKPDITAPGSALISLRDRHIITSPDFTWVSTVGTAGSDTSYVVMQGTSMACPVASGSAALLLSKTPTMSPQNVYDAIVRAADVDPFTGNVPNNTWGSGKLNLNASYALITAIRSAEILPNTFSLDQNFPNPFNPSTTIRYGLPWAADVTIVIFDLLGREVTTLVHERQQAGSHDILFDGAHLTSGMYFCRLQAGAYRNTKKLLLLK